MSEDAPMESRPDQDFVAPPTTESLRVENEHLRKALETHDYATFSLWLEKNERELQDDPVEHAQLLARAATILNAVGNDEGAVTLLLRAAPLVRGKDPEVEERLLSLLQVFGGDDAVAAYSSALREAAEVPKQQELAALQKRYAEISEELVALDAHDWKKRTGTTYSEEERSARIIQLRAELQTLITKRAELKQ